MFVSPPIGSETPPPASQAPVPTGTAPSCAAPSCPAPSCPAIDRARRLAACADSTLTVLTLVERAIQTLCEPEHAPAYPPHPHPTAEDIATLVKAHTTLARSLRQTSALEAKLEALTAAGPAAFLESETRRTQLRKTYIRKIEDAISEHARPEARENLLHEFYERLDDPELGTEIDIELLADGTQPIAAQTCRDLGIIAATLAYPRRTPQALTQLLARANARPKGTGPP